MRPDGPDAGLGLHKARPYLHEEDVAGLLEDFESILRAGILTMGPYVERFEEAFAATVGSRHAVALSSGTAPMEIALRYWEVAGGEVVMTTNTFMATAHAALLAGARPVLADIEPACWSSTLDQIRPLVGPRTRAIVVVHVGGLIVPDIEAIAAFCAERGLPLLEDAAHAHGAVKEGRMAGSLGTAGSFSFFPTKVMTTGEGGMLTTDDPRLADYGRSFRCHGIGDDRLLVRLGSNYRMPELSAALGLRQLRRLSATVAERGQLAAAYDRGLDRRGVPHARFPTPDRGQLHAYYKYPVGVETDRQTLAAAMASRGVSVGSLYWPPCHLQPSSRQYLGTTEGDCPVAEDLLRRTVTLPLYNGLTVDQVTAVVERLAESMSVA
jgi:dTDP-4-amino-4,6-dideoxygalactose transaminase